MRITKSQLRRIIKEWRAGGLLDLSEYSLGLNENNMKITKDQLRRIIKEEKQKLLKEMANQEQDFVVGGYSGGYSSNSVRYDYIVSAINKNEAKKILKAVKPHLRKINATPVTDYTQFNPYSTFERL